MRSTDNVGVQRKERVVVWKKRESFGEEVAF